MQKSDLAQEVVKGAPPVAVTLASMAGVTLHDLVMGATLFYVVLQAAFLLWKWYRLATRGEPAVGKDDE